MTENKDGIDACNELACEIIKKLGILPQLLLLDENPDKLAKARRLAVYIGGALEEFVVRLDGVMIIKREE